MASLRSLAAVAAALSRRYGVDITCSGAGAWTSVGDGGKMTINIPASVSTEGDALMLLRGYLDHECGHARWTDFGAPSSTVNELVHTMANIFEDVRIEALMSDAFEGARQNLHDIAVHLFGGDEWKARAESVNQLGCILAWILWHVRKDACPELEHGERMLRGMSDAHAPGLAEKLLAAMEQYPRDTTESCWQAAHACARLLRGYGSDDREEGQNGQGQEDRERTEEAMSELSGGDGKAVRRLRNAVEKLARSYSVMDRACGFDADSVDRLVPTPRKGMSGLVNEALDRDNPDQNASDASAASASGTG